MGDPRGFLDVPAQHPKRRPVDVRIQDWREVYQDFESSAVRKQAGRCMDCGIPFCHNACPLGNLIPEWNDLVFSDDWRLASERLHATNNFPEFTGRLCPAPCESACVVGISGDPVTIKQVEVSIIDRAWDADYVQPMPPERLSGKTVAVIGSGPAGLAAAQQLARTGHTVAVYERSDRIGGLLRYGIPEFKMEKHHIDRRLMQMQAEGVKFRTGVEVGVDISASELRSRYDAIILATGTAVPRDLNVPGRELTGIYQAMDYLPNANRANYGEYADAAIEVAGKNVVIIGGGDTGADCLGTALRQGAASVTQLEIMPQPPQSRSDESPWPTHPLLYRVTSAHEEGGQRTYSVSTKKFLGEGSLTGIEVVDVEFDGTQFNEVIGSNRVVPVDIVFLALGFTGPETQVLTNQLDLELDGRGNFGRNDSYATNIEGVFVAGDAGRGQSLIVWAIAEGRSVAAHVDSFLSGSSTLPIPIAATAKPLGT
jgi:glutamate synthase (NADPH/NADH) small chain